MPEKPPPPKPPPPKNVQGEYRLRPYNELTQRQKIFWRWIFYSLGPMAITMLTCFVIVKNTTTKSELAAVKYQVKLELVTKNCKAQLEQQELACDQEVATQAMRTAEAESSEYILHEMFPLSLVSKKDPKDIEGVELHSLCFTKGLPHSVWHEGAIHRGTGFRYADKSDDGAFVVCTWLKPRL